jgi:hypothetical protein
LASLAESGQQTPIVVVAAEGQPDRLKREFVLVLYWLDQVRPALLQSAKVADNRRVTSFAPECELCAELLADYITAGNEFLETRERLHSHKHSALDHFSLALMNDARKRRSNARKRLLIHKKRHQ